MERTRVLGEWAEYGPKVGIQPEDGAQFGKMGGDRGYFDIYTGPGGDLC
jgi:hypothetical protein